MPSLLEKFPSVDRAKVAFPPELVDFFFDMEETIWTRGEVDSYADRYLISSGLDRRRLEDHYQQEVCTGVDGTIIYITTHMFFEDLAKIQESLPINRDYLEDLNSKEDKQDLDESLRPRSTQSLSQGHSEHGSVKSFRPRNP